MKVFNVSLTGMTTLYWTVVYTSSVCYQGYLKVSARSSSFPTIAIYKLLNCVSSKIFSTIGLHTDVANMEINSKRKHFNVTYTTGPSCL